MVQVKNTPRMDFSKFLKKGGEKIKVRQLVAHTMIRGRQAAHARNWRGNGRWSTRR